jgi:phosphatidylserine/phosphatidylglycerophosphate/cardiolipin synthase-like enzyme
VRITNKNKDLIVKGYAGSTGVLLAFDVPEAKSKGLLGFAVEERKEGHGFKWLTGRLEWTGRPVIAPGTSFESNDHPIQKFRWSDYGVEPGRGYDYRIHPVYGTPDKLELRDPVELKLTTSNQLEGGHSVFFNRAAAASQAFVQTFPDINAQMKAAQDKGKEVRLPDEARTWLSRGLEEAIIGLIDEALDSTWALDVGIYEYELDHIVAAVKAAQDRGVEVRVVYHAKPGDEQTTVNQSKLKGIKQKVGRVTSAIFHDKFIVLSRLKNQTRTPKAVLCGSTNFTENGIYRQANVAHIIREGTVAGQYLTLFERLFAGEKPAQTRTINDQTNPMLEGEPLFVGFSPRTGKGDLVQFVSEIHAAKRDVMFATAFELYDAIGNALLGTPEDDVLRLGVQNKESGQLTGIHRDRNARFTASALINTPFENFLKESYAGQIGSLHIHTKIVVIDFTSDKPVVISGSHNLSNNASVSNDENFLIIRDRPDIADCYGIEVLRIYDHYRFRRNRKVGEAAPSLTATDQWTRRYFQNRLEVLDRLRFSGQG